MKKSNRKQNQTQETASTYTYGILYYSHAGEDQFPHLEGLIQANRDYRIAVVTDTPNDTLRNWESAQKLTCCTVETLRETVEAMDAQYFLALDSGVSWNINKTLHSFRPKENAPLYLPESVQKNKEKPGLGGIFSRLYYRKMNAFFSPATEHHNEYEAFLIEKEALTQVLEASRCDSLQALHHRVIQTGLEYGGFELVPSGEIAYAKRGTTMFREGLRSYGRWFFKDALRQFRNKDLEFPVRLQGLSRFLFAVFFLACLVVMPYLSKDYGITWDEKIQYEYAQDIYAYLTSFGEDQSIFDFKNKSTLWQPMRYYGSFFDVLTVAVIDIFGIEDVFETRHFMNAIFGVFGLLFCGLVARSISGNWTHAFLAFLFLLLTPSFFGHSMNNPKDVPFATGFFMSVYFMIRFIRQLPRPTFATLLLLSLSIGLSISIRVGGILIYPYLLLFGGIKWIGVAYKEGSGPAFRQLPKYLGSFVIVLVFGWFLGGIFWPYAWQNPISNPIKALEGLSNVTYTTSYETFEGVRTYMSQVPWYYSLKWMLIGSSLVVLVGFAIQLVRIPFTLKKMGWWNAMFLFMLVFPIYWAVHKESMLYNGWRHWFFIYVSVAVLAAWGWTWVLENKQVWMRYLGAALLLIGCGNMFGWLIRSHPNQYVYFNEFVGGIEGAYGNYETDYYSNSLKQAVEWFVENVDVNSRHLTVVTNNEPLTAQYYMSKYTDSVDVLWTREYELSKKPADYAIFTSRTMSKTTLQEGYFPPRGTIHTIDLDGVPLCAIIKRENSYMADGSADLERGNLRSAVDQFAAAAQYDPGNEEAWRHLGLCYANMGAAYTDSALVALEKAIETLPESFIAYDIAGMVFSGNQQYDTAASLFKESISYKINYTNAHYNLGIAYFNLGNYQGAAEEFENSIRYGGQKPQFYKLLGAAMINLNRLSEAIQYLTYAAQNSNDWEAYSYLGQAYQAQGNKDAAQQMFAKAQQLRGG